MLPLSVSYRSICASSTVYKKHANPEEEVLVHKTSLRSTNKKPELEKRAKAKQTVWGIVDVYRFITIESLAKLLKKSTGWFNCVNILNVFDVALHFFAFCYFRGIARGSVVLSTSYRYSAKCED